MEISCFRCEKLSKMYFWGRNIRHTAHSSGSIPTITIPVIKSTVWLKDNKKITMYSTSQTYHIVICDNVIRERDINHQRCVGEISQIKCSVCKIDYILATTVLYILSTFVLYLSQLQQLEMSKKNVEL